MGKLILLVDDDRLPTMRFYIKALTQEGYTVEHRFDPDGALEFIAQAGPEIAIIILDIMMPPGDAYKEEDTNEGLKAGLLLGRDISRRCPQKPIIVLTNVRNPDTLSAFSKIPLARIVQKTECSPFELVELVNDTFAQTGERPT